MNFRFFVILHFILFLIRIYIISKTFIIDDEAYYHMYSKHLAWGYIDHGPIVTFLIKIFSIFSESGFSLRFGAVLSTCILSISMYFFGKFYFNQKTGMFLSLLISANLLFHINSTIITPDVPLSFCLILAIMGYYISYHYNEKLIYISGFFLGMAILSKITAVFTALAIATYPFIAKDLKHWIYKKEFHLSFLIAFIVFSPFIIWNINNDFAFIRYQGAHVTEGGDFEDFFELWLSLIILVGPLLYYYSVLYPLKKILSLKKLNENSTYFIYITAVPLIYFITHSIFSKFEINWPAPIFLSGLFIVGIKLGQIESFSKKILFQIGYSASLIIIITVQTFKPFLPTNSKSDVTNRYHVYKDLLIEIPKILRDSPELRGLRIASNNYQIPSIVNFYLEPHLEATCLSIGYHETLYSFIHDDIIGEDFLFIKPKYGRPDWMESNFQSMSFIKEFTAIRDNNIIAKYSVWHLKNYLGKESVY